MRQYKLLVQSIWYHSTNVYKLPGFHILIGAAVSTHFNQPVFFLTFNNETWHTSLAQLGLPKVPSGFIEEASLSVLHSDTHTIQDGWWQVTTTCRLNKRTEHD